MRIIGEVGAAALAVIGFYSLLRFIGEVFLTSRPITTAVRITTREELESLELLLGEADRHSLRTRGHSVVVLFAQGLLPGDGAGRVKLPPSVAELLGRYRAVWYAADPDGGWAGKSGETENR